MHAPLRAALVSSTLALASVAHAGPGDPGYGMPPPGAPPAGYGAPPPAAPPPGASGVVVVEQTGGYGQPMPAPQQPMGPPPPPPFSQPRFRWGFSLLAGPGNIGGGNGVSYATGVGGGASLRLGYQIDRMWSVTYQGTAIIGGWETKGGLAAGAFGAVYNILAGNVTLFDQLEFGLGVSLDRMAMVGVGVTDRTYGFAGNGVGIDLRAAVTLGQQNPALRYRHGFTFSVQVHPTFIDGLIVNTTLIGIGGEWF